MCALLVCLMMISTLSYAQIQTEEMTIGERNPGQAYLMSAIFPGAGQMCNNQIDLGITVLIGEAALFGIGTFFALDDSPGISRLGQVMIVGGVIVHIAQAIQAPYYSVKLNDWNGYKNHYIISHLEVGVQASTSPAFLRFRF